MRITERTKYSTIIAAEKYFTPAAVAKLKKAAEDKFGAMYDLPFSAFHACVNGDFAEVLGKLENPTVFQVYWCKRFADFVGEFADAMKELTLQPTPEENEAAATLLKTDWGENMLVFLQSFFELPSFKDAEKITTGEILIAKRAQYNRDKYQRELNKKQMQKYKAKK